MPNLRQPEPGRRIIRKSIPEITLHNEGASVGSEEWTKSRVFNAVLVRRMCACDQCDCCLVAMKFLGISR